MRPWYHFEILFCCT